MINYYSCCTYINHQAKFNETRLIWQTNSSYCDYLVEIGVTTERKIVFMENDRTPCGYQIRVLFIVFEGLFVLF